MRSDAFFQDPSITVPALLRKFRPRNSAHPAPGLTSHLGADVSFAWDRPYSYGPNAGVQFWRNSPRARQLLSLWWHLPGGQYHLTHDYEQHALQWYLQHISAYGQSSGRLEALELTPFPLGVDSRGWPNFSHPVAHIDHARNFYRLLLMSIALLRGGGRDAPHDRPLDDAPANRAMHPASAGGAARDIGGAHWFDGAAGLGRAGGGSVGHGARRRMEGMSELRQAGRDALGGIGGASTSGPMHSDGAARAERAVSERNHQTATLRTRLLKAALRSMRRRERQHNGKGMRQWEGGRGGAASGSVSGSPQGGSHSRGGGGGASRADPGGAEAGGPPGCVVHVEMFNSSAAAVAHMTPAAARATPQAGGHQREGREPGGMAREASRREWGLRAGSRQRAATEREAPAASTLPLRLSEVLGGLPLQLANCSPTDASADRRGALQQTLWQRWRRDSGLLVLQPPTVAVFGGGNASGGGLSRCVGRGGTVDAVGTLAARVSGQTAGEGGSPCAAYCMRIGPARAPRQPDFPLAQLAVCDSLRDSGATSGGTDRSSGGLGNASAGNPLPSEARLQSFSYNATVGKIYLRPTVDQLSLVAETGVDSARSACPRLLSPSSSRPQPPSQTCRRELHLCTRRLRRWLPPDLDPSPPAPRLQRIGLDTACVGGAARTGCRACRRRSGQPNHVAGYRLADSPTCRAAPPSRLCPSRRRVPRNIPPLRAAGEQRAPAGS